MSSKSKYASLSGCYLDKIEGSNNFYIHYPKAKRIFRKSTGTSVEAEAEIELAKFVQTYTQPVEAKETELQIAVALERYWREHASLLPCQSTVKSAVATLIEFFGTDSVDDLTPQRITAFVASERKRGLRDASINRELGSLKAALRREWKNKRLRSVPYIQGIAENSRETAILTESQLQEFIDRCRPTEHLFRYVMISCNTLCRPAAALELMGAQCDFESGTINLNPKGRKQQRNKFRPIVRITETLRPLLEAWARETPKGIPLVNYGRKPIKCIRGSFHTIVEDMGLEVTEYTLRHSMTAFVTAARARDGDIARQLGHKAPNLGAVTARYQHLHPDYLRDIADIIDSIMARVTIPPGTKIMPISGSNVVEIGERKRA